MPVKLAVLCALVLGGCTDCFGPPGGSSTCCGLTPAEIDKIDAVNAEQDARTQDAADVLAVLDVRMREIAPETGARAALAAGRGVVLRTPEGTCFKLSVVTGGELVTDPVACP